MIYAGTNGLFGSTPNDSCMRVVSGGDWGLRPGTLGQHGPWPTNKDPDLQSQNNLTLQEAIINDYATNSQPLFVYSYPVNQQDRISGAVCSISGFWAAGRDIVYIDGKPMIREFARRSRNERYRAFGRNI